MSSAIIPCIKTSCPSCHFSLPGITFVYVLNCGILDFSLEHIGKWWMDCELWINSGVSQV